VKRLLGLLSLVAFVLVFGPSPAQAANVWAATLYQLDGSGISAAATLAEQSDGTVQVVLTASGLKAGVQYISGVYNRSSIACRGGLIRAATTSGFSDTYTSREGGVTFTAQGPLSNVFSISVRETTEGRAPGTERACAERFPASLRATVQQEGSTATITLRLFNLSRETLALADIRGPIPAGMSLVTSSPTAQLVGNEARWLHISDMGPGQTRTFTYRLNTDGLGGSFRGLCDLILDLLGKVERALEMVRAGSYGICESCGKSIPLARLEALPYATLCVDCARRVLPADTWWGLGWRPSW